ncbi:MAG TPA: CBS domain-containing protein [Gemmatimonadales bacterium]|nr:CBS domain-containing protein [Gemmatimonadales bacterium]
MTYLSGTTHRVADLMTPDVHAIAPDAMLAEAVRLMADEHISALAVTAADGRLLGVVSTADVLQAEAESDAGEPDARNALLERTLVEDIMNRTPISIGPDAGLREAAQHMLYAEVHRLFVQRDGRLVGVISQTDLVRALAQGKA